MKTIIINGVEYNLTPKVAFHKGDWVVDKNGIVKQILSYKDGVYKHTNGYSAEIFSDEWMLWDITKDAKDGDVLVCEDFGYTSLMLFESFSNGRISLHCWHNSQTNNFHINTDVALRKDANIYPATKEQRDALMKAMSDAGYAFDFDKKELKKIEQKTAELSKENENRIKDIIYFLDTAKKHYASTVELDACIAWLKSFRPQSQWRPSKEQMEALKSSTYCQNKQMSKVLFELYQDLKKLREE